MNYSCWLEAALCRVRWGAMLAAMAASVVTLNAATRETTVPIEGLRNASPRTHALVGARVIVAPGRVIDKGVIVVRDGVVAAVGADVAIPSDAQVWDVAGAIIYPGFFESYSTAFLPETWKPVPSSGGSGRAAPAEATVAVAAASDGGARAWNPRITPDREAHNVLIADARGAERLRGLGFTVAHVVPGRGILRGQSALVSLSGAPFNVSIVRAGAAQIAAFEFGGFLDGGGRYPTSLMGTIALLRQTFLDAQWHQAAHAAFARTPGVERPEANNALAALGPVIEGRQVVIFDAQDELDVDRVQKLAREFKLRAAVRGSGTEYRMLAGLSATKTPVVLPLNFPEAPEIETAEKAADITLDQLQHWELAPSNPARLATAGVPVAFTAAELKRENEFWGKVRIAVKAGLTAEQALAALTTTPAELFGISATHGSLEKGKAANLVVARGDLFTAADAEIELVFVDGEAFEQEAWKRYDTRGIWAASWTGAAGPREFTIRGAKPGRLRAKAGGKDITAVAQKDGVVLLAPAELFGASGGIVRLSARGTGEVLRGTGELPDGTAFRWSAERTGSAPAEEPRGARSDDRVVTKSETVDGATAGGSVNKDQSAEPPAAKPAEKPDAKKILSSLTYPAGAFGRAAVPVQPERVLVKNATIWTSAAAGILKNADLLIHAGKIEKVGASLAAPAGAVVIDATGRHVTPGLIDCHSHIAAQRGINEGGSSVTCEVRVADVLDPTDINIYRQLAGGLTTANILHGSANSIGGQNAVIKLRWGQGAGDLPIAGAKPGVKFALGENPVRANVPASSASRPRYPGTRMGVRETILDAFRRAADYDHAWAEFRAGRLPLPPRRDLRLEAAGEMLRGERIIHIHSYRQDEVLMFIRLAQELKLHVATFQHILEGYKVAPEIAQLGAGASSFADWWAYKYEVVDAIPHNGAMLQRAGVITSFNSDDAEMARRMNTEAAKAVKYGGLSLEEALKFVTINPARQLRIDNQTGSLEVGKDADFVIWDASPLSSAARPEQTWVEGRRYFDLQEDIALRAANAVERAALIQKALPERQRALGGGAAGGESGEGDGPPPTLRALLNLFTHETNEYRAIYHDGGSIHNCGTHAGGMRQ